jgi:anaerobic selenocysteine-containing dehydrogenase
MAETYMSPEHDAANVAEQCGVSEETIRRLAAELAHVAFEQEITLPIEWTDFRGEKHKEMTGRPVSFHAMRGNFCTRKRFPNMSCLAHTTDYFGQCGSARWI